MNAYDSDRDKNIETQFVKVLPSIWNKAKKETDKALEIERKMFGQARKVSK
ncbi:MULTISPECIES: hypothetical protein [unclassified Paenibacillus]|uniref:Uncharacterized protein n=1 Tax=Paenibacillus provencensis TaxID=441151 RepID=A0ABW3PT10_9BACL|nr:MULTISPECIES: hypothetical protein [unclassified Paenibacillus]MCM3129362.1 hypothetical protein [Paenibacillus sp. MER 78]